MAAVSEIRVQASGTSTLSAEFRKAAGEVRQFGGDLDKLSQSQLAKTEASLRTLGLEGSNAFKKMRQGFQEAKLTEAMETLRRSSFATTEEVKRAADVYQQKLAAIRSGSAAATGGVSQLQGGLQSINAGLQSAAVNTGVFGQAIGALTSPLGLVALAFSAVAAAATLGVNAMVNNANEVRNLMAVSGLAAEEADNLADTFALLGKDGDTLRNALFKMGQELDSGGAGMEKLGISLRDTSGAIKTEGALLLEARDAISKMGSASERSAALTTLFGKAGRELADVFALSADKFQEYARQAGIISEWNGRLQSTTQDYILAQAKLRLELDALLQQIGQLIIPALTKFVGVVSQLVAIARDPITVTFKIVGLPNAIQQVNEFAERIAELRPGGKPAAEIPVGGGTPGVEAEAGAVGVDTRILKGELDMAKAIADGRLAILQAGLAKEQAARQLAVAQGRMTEQQALQASLAGISRLSSAQQAAYAANLATLDKKEQREAATAAHTAAMIGLETQRLGILTQIARAQAAPEPLTAHFEEVKDVTTAWKQFDAVLAEMDLGLQEVAKPLQYVGDLATRFATTGDDVKFSLGGATTAVIAFGAAFGPITQEAADAIEVLEQFGPILTGSQRAFLDFQTAMAEAGLKSRVLGGDFDFSGARVAALRAQLDRMMVASHNEWTPEIQALGDEIRASLADQSLYEGIKAGLLSITDTITKMVTAWIQGTLTWKSAGETLLGFLLNFGQTILHKVLDPILEGLAQVAAAWASSFLFGRGGGGLAASAGSALGGLFAGGGGGGAVLGVVDDLSGNPAVSALPKTLLDVGGGLTSIYTVGQAILAKSGIVQLPTVLDLVASGVKSVAASMGLLTQSATVSSAAIDALISEGFVVPAAAVADAAEAASLGLGAATEAVSSLASVASTVTSSLPLIGAYLLAFLAGPLDMMGRDAKEFRNRQREIQGEGFTRDLIARMGQVGAGTLSLSDPKVRNDLSVLAAQAVHAEAGLQDFLRQNREQVAGGAAPNEDFVAGYQRSIDALNQFVAQVRGLGIEVSRDEKLMEIITKDFADLTSLTSRYAEIIAAAGPAGGAAGGAGEVVPPVDAQRAIDVMVFDLQTSALDAIAKALGVVIEGLPDITAGMMTDVWNGLDLSTKAGLDAFVATMREGLTTALVDEPTKILGLLDLSSLAQEGETLQQTAQREATALATLGQRMDALAEATDALERNLTIPQQLAEDMGKVTAAMDAAHIAWATTQDPSKMLAAEQELERLIVERYNLQRAAEAELLAQVRQYASVVASSAQALAAAEPTLTALGISIQGMSADLATLVSGLDDASADLALLPAVIASAVAEASQSGGGLAGALDPVVSALEATFEDIAAILDPSERAAALQGLLAQIDSVYQQAVAGITAFYEEQRRQARALDELAQYEYAKQINALIAVQQEQEAAIAGLQAIVDRATAALTSMAGSMGDVITLAESLGLSLDGVGTAMAAWVAGLGDAQQQLAALPGVIAAAAGAARQAAARGPQGPETATAAVSAGLDVLLPSVVASFQATADNIERILDPIERGAAWQNLIGQMNTFQSQTIAGIHSFYDAARSEAQSLADTALQGIRDAANAQIDAIRTASDAEIRGIRAATDLTVKGLDAQRDALNQQLSASREMARIASGLRKTISDLTIGTQAPPDAQAQFAAAMSAFQTATPETAGAAAQTLLDTAISTGLYTRPDPEYRRLFANVTSRLADLAAQAEAQVTPEEQMAASLESIDAQISAARSAGDSQVAAVEAARDAKIAGVEAARAASEAALQEELKLYLAQLSTDERTQTGAIGGALYSVGVQALTGIASATAATEAMRNRAAADSATTQGLLTATNSAIVSLVAPVSTLPDALKQIDGNEQAALATLNGTIYGVASATIAELQKVSRDVSTQATDAKNQLAEVRGMRVDLGADFAALKGSIRDSLDSLVRSRLDALLQSSDPAATIANTLSPQLSYITSNTSAAAFNLAEIVRGSFRDTIQPRYPSYAGGIADTGPRSFLAILDPHERVLTAAENRAYASRSPSGVGGAPGDVSVTFAPGAIVVNGVNDPEGIVRKIQGPLVRMVTRELRLKQDMYLAAQGRG